MTFTPGPHEQELIRLRDAPYWDAATVKPLEEGMQFALADLRHATVLLATDGQGDTILAAIESATSTIKDTATVVAPIPTVDDGVQKANEALQAARYVTLPQGSLSEGDAKALSIAEIGAKIAVPGYGLFTVLSGFNAVDKVNEVLAKAREEEAARQVEILKGELDAARRAITKPELISGGVGGGIPDPLDPADFGLGPQPGPAPSPGPAPGAPHTLPGGTGSTGGIGGTGTGLTGSTGGGLPYGTPAPGTSGTSGVGGGTGVGGSGTTIAGSGITGSGIGGTSGSGIGGSGGFPAERTAVDSLMGGTHQAGLGMLGAGTAGLGLGVAGKIGGSMMSTGAMGGSAGGFGALSPGGLNSTSGAGGMGSASNPITSHPVRLTITNPNAPSGFAPGRGLLSGMGTGVSNTSTGTSATGTSTGTSNTTGTSSGTRNTMMGNGTTNPTKKDKPEPRTGRGLFAPKIEIAPITLRHPGMMAGSRKPTPPPES